MRPRKEDKEAPKRQSAGDVGKKGMIDPGRTPGTAEGDENTVDKALRNKERRGGKP
jgi:hypothetical protein